MLKFTFTGQAAAEFIANETDRRGIPEIILLGLKILNFDRKSWRNSTIHLHQNTPNDAPDSHATIHLENRSKTEKSLK